MVVVSGYDVVAAQTVHARKSYEHPAIRFGHRYADILDTADDGRLRIDYGRFHDTFGGIGTRHHRTCAAAACSTGDALHRCITHFLFGCDRAC